MVEESSGMGRMKGVESILDEGEEEEEEGVIVEREGERDRLLVEADRFGEGGGENV